MEGVDEPTLCELLEIVDAWAPGTPVAVCQEAAESPSPVVSSGSSGSDGGSLVGKSRKRTRNPEADARRRLKKKKEREALCALVRELEGRQEQLRRNHRRQRSFLAANAAEALCRSDEVIDKELATTLGVNKQLKAEVAKNALLIRVLHDAVSAPKVEMALPDAVVASALTTHRSALQSMYAGLATVFKPFPVITTNEPFFYRSDIKFNAAGTLRVELSTALDLPWDLRRASLAFTKGIVQLSPFGQAVSHCLEAQTGLAEQAYSLDGCAPNTSPGLRSIGLVQKHQSDDCVVVMWSSQIFHPAAGMAFIGRSRIRITGLSSDRTLIEAFTDISATEMPSSSLDPIIDPDSEKSVRNALVSAFGNRIGFKHKAFLKRMLTMSGRPHHATAIML